MLTFVAVFLLREWISQNARPGFFDEDNLPEDLPEPAPAPPPPPTPPQPVMVPVQLPDPPLVLNIRPRDNVRASGTALPRRPVGSPNDRGLRRRHSSIRDSETEEDDRSQDRVRKQSFGRRLHAARMETAQKRREEAGEDGPFQDPTIHPRASLANYPFTFKADLPAPRPRRASSLGEESSPPSAAASSSSLPIFPEVTLDPPRGTIPFQLHRFNDSGTFTGEPISPTSLKFRRPQPPGVSSGFPSESPFALSPARTPLESPSLSTYRPPEDLEAGPSNRGYFDHSLPSHGEETEDEELVHVNVSDDSGELVEVPRDMPNAEASVNVPRTPPEEMDHYFAEAEPELLFLDDPEEEGEDSDESEEREREDWAALGEEVAPDPAMPALEAMEQVQEGIEAVRAAADAVAIAEAQEDLEANAEDDMEGAMEGMFGKYSVTEFCSPSYSDWHAWPDLRGDPKCKTKSF